MTQSNRLGSISLAILLALLGLFAATVSLAHNIEGVLPRITAAPGSFEYFIQWVMEGGSTFVLNLASLFFLTLAYIAWVRKFYLTAPLLTIIAIMAMTYSGFTQLGVVADKTFTVSNSKHSALDTYNKNLESYNYKKSQLPAGIKFIDDANIGLQKAVADLKSVKYGSKTAWQTTNQCKDDITAKQSKKLCDEYYIAKRVVADAKKGAKLLKEMGELMETIKDGPPESVDTAPQMIVDVFSEQNVTITGIYKVIAALKSFSIDLIASVLFSLALKLWPDRAYKPAPSPNDNGGETAHAETPIKNDGPNKGVQTREKRQALIDNMKMGVTSVQNTEHAQNSVFKALQTLSIDGEFKTNYREISACTKDADGYGVATGAMNEVLQSLTTRGLIERYSSKGKGTCGRVLVHEHAFA